MNHDVILLGIDGGGTQTRALLAGIDGEIIGSGIGGPSNYQAVGLEVAREGIAQAVRGAWQNAGIGERPADAAFLGLAGVTSAADRGTMERVARELNLAQRIGIDHDIRTALAGGIPGRAGIALIAGTGSAAYGRTADGRSWRAGGWGHVLDDAGSGYWLGVQGLSAVTRHLDGREGPTMLSEILLGHLGVTDPDTILHLMGTNGLSRTEIAALAPLMLAAADHDSVALRIVNEGARQLALMAWAVAGKLALAAPEVMMTGGLMNHASYRELVVNALAARLTAARVAIPLLPPAAGAALLAMELLKRPADADALERMAHAMRQPS